MARESTPPLKAVASAIADVKRAIPKGAFVAADPDLVGLADIAKLADMTRQNLQEYATNASVVAFPPPVVLGNDAKWRLAEVEPWLQQINPGALTPKKIDVSLATTEFNIKHQSQRLQRAVG